MEVEKTLKPGAQGTTKYLTRFGDRLVCVRHRLDRAANKRFTTVELIVNERSCAPRYQHPFGAGPDDICQLRIQSNEQALIALVRRAAGRWDPSSRTWLLDVAEVERHCLWDRVIKVLPPRYGQ